MTRVCMQDGAGKSSADPLQSLDVAFAHVSVPEVEQLLQFGQVFAPLREEFAPLRERGAAGLQAFDDLLDPFDPFVYLVVQAHSRITPRRPSTSSASTTIATL